jgi:hypothetical protein
MNLLDEGIIHRVQNNLAESRQIRMSYGALWFNTLMFIGVIAISYAFLTLQYHSTKHVIQSVNIPKTELIWNNSIRNAIDS